jgi:predicted metal-dependent HD superfamily phosphohydrolase
VAPDSDCGHQTIACYKKNRNTFLNDHFGTSSDFFFILLKLYNKKPRQFHSLADKAAMITFLESCTSLIKT